MDTILKGKRGFSDMMPWIFVAFIIFTLLVSYATLNNFVVDDMKTKLFNQLKFNDARFGNASEAAYTKTSGTWDWLPWGALVAVFFIALYSAFTPSGGEY